MTGPLAAVVGLAAVGMLVALVDAFTRWTDRRGEIKRAKDAQHLREVRRQR